MSVDGDSGPGDARVHEDLDLDHDRGDDPDASLATQRSVPKRRKLVPRPLPLIGVPTLLCVLGTLGSAALYTSLYKDDGPDIDEFLQNGDKLLGIDVVRWEFHVLPILDDNPLYRRMRQAVKRYGENIGYLTWRVLQFVYHVDT